MLKCFKKIHNLLNHNPYDTVIESYNKQIKEHPYAVNLSKLAVYCNCDVNDVIKEIRIGLKDVENEQEN